GCGAGGSRGRGGGFAAPLALSGARAGGVGRGGAQAGIPLPATVRLRPASGRLALGSLGGLVLAQCLADQRAVAPRLGQLRIVAQGLAVGVQGGGQLAAPGQRVAAVVVGGGIVAGGEGLRGGGVVAGAVEGDAAP